MSNYLLSDYHFSNNEVVYSTATFGYGTVLGLRHLREAKLHPENKWTHYFIAAIEFSPGVGTITSLIEMIAVKHFAKNYQPVLTRSPLIFRGSQWGSQGQVDVYRAQEVFDKIAGHKVRGIYFNPDKIQSTISGGTCTAMSLDFAKRLIELKRKLCPKQPEIFLKALRELGAQLTKSSSEMRNCQAAFNTIEVVKSVKADIAKNKMQSLANFHDLTIDYASQEMDLNTVSETEGEQQIQAMPAGVSLARILKPAENEKLEEYGHTLVYFRESALELIYDPNLGLANLSTKVDDPKAIANFKFNNYMFKVNRLRLYHLADKPTHDI